MILILTFSIALTLVVEVIAVEFFNPATERERLLDKMYSGIIAILSMWVGRHLSRHRTSHEEDAELEKLAKSIKDHTEDFMTADEIKAHLKNETKKAVKKEGES